MNNEILMSLMQQVEYRLDNLLNVLANNQYEIHRLQNENNQLRNDYVRILDQINIYVNELEEIKKLQK
ncbi:hypothetical protein BA173_02890 [Rickettsia sp. MEAM1 (Bemisia tabaci)]|uniref:Uncharacterized protein n=3 Tax=Rickettsia TaxID=780 RepID=A0A0F3QMK3_RICBE|nr:MULTISPECIES: hypothetical protein [Rickettsia]HJD63032.1 hypothetical protein [Rickettsia endosymbiont of Degeeriella rufa]HJD68000.1 hypothetical protein [Rickettsia endosymbiont of Bembidion lapponicum]ABV78540.1 hypothetical protein A1I_00700 [Rickettsia bellii OSU 85-389]ARD86054.1 hypothetical protein A3306_02170 [Rickettsia bellii]ASX27813.1 hypothetical protein BA173_02890 [Rickettsia sp. MEAM1 (Bemisia tabaci)]